MAFGSTSYIVVKYLRGKEKAIHSLSSEVKQSLDASSSRTLDAISRCQSALHNSIAGLSSSVDQISICDTLKIIGYKQLMQTEKDCRGKKIIIVTNSLADDASEDQILPTIIANMKRGKHYQFIAPDTTQNRRDAEALKERIASATLPPDCGAKDSYIYFASDDMFKICAFRDIAIYGAGATEKKLMVGYAELPGRIKTEEASTRTFMEIDRDVCMNLVADIDSVLNRKNSKQYFDTLSIISH